MTSQRTKKIIVKNPPEASLVAEFLEYTDSWIKPARSKPRGRILGIYRFLEYFSKKRQTESLFYWNSSINFGKTYGCIYHNDVQKNIIFWYNIQNSSGNPPLCLYIGRTIRPISTWYLVLATLRLHCAI